MVICNRIFYFFLYISFVYRNTIVLSNPTSTISTNGNGAIVDPNAAPVAAPVPQVLNASAPITPGAPAMPAPVPGAPAMAAPIPGSQPIASPIPGAPAMTAPIPGAPAMTAPIPGAPAMTAPIPGAHAMTAPIAGAPVAPVAHAHTPAASFVDPSTHMGTPITPGGPAMAAAVPGAHAMTAPVAGSPAMATPMTHGAPAMGAPVAGAPGAHSVTISIPSGNANAGLAGAPAMAAPVAGAPVAHAHTPAASFVDPNHAPALSAPIAGAPGAPVAHSVTISIPSGNANAEGVGAPITSGSIVPTPITAGAQPMAAAVPGAQAMTSPITAGAPLMGAPVLTGAPTMTAPMTPVSHIVATPANPGAPVVAIPVDSGNLGSDPNAKPLTKVTIDIRTKEDTQYVKYRTLDVNETEIWYALEGYIISEIQVGGNRRWPKENEVKECKKVLFFKNPDDGKKTLRVIYADEADAYDPDDPPKESTDPTEKVGAPAHGATESSPLSSEATSSYKDPAELTRMSPPATVPPSGEYGTGATDKAIDGLAALLSATDPNTFASASAYTEHQYKQDANGQTYVEFTVPSDKASGERVTSTTTSGGFTVEEVRVPRSPHGHTLVYEDSDSDDEFIPGEDGDNEAVNLTTYVSRVGRRVRSLEDRMDSAEGTIKLLTMTLNYQHELLDFKKRFGGKTAPFAGKAAPFGADFGRHAHFDTDGFRPATSLVSKILDSSEYPSDIKLLVADAADATKLVDLATDKFKVKQEGDEIHYVLESDVNCKLVTFKGKTVWNHREADPHPVGVVFHPDDDKVVVDFDDAIVMYVKKGELAGVAPNERVKHSIVDISLRGLDSDNEDEDKDEDKASGEAEGGAAPGADVETGDAAGANEESGVTAGPSGEAGIANEETTITSGGSGETIVTPESAPVPSVSAPAPEVHTASSPDATEHSAVPEAKPAESTAQPTLEASATPVAHTVPATPAEHTAVPSVDTSATAVPIVESSATPVAQPVAVPVTPVAQPVAVPVTPVAQTAAVPAVPVAQPASVPAVPVAQPASVPAVPVAQPASVPVAPIAQPVTPVAQPVAVPVTPVAQTASVTVVDPSTAVPVAESSPAPVVDSSATAIPALPAQPASVPVVDTSATAVPSTDSSETTDLTVEDSSDVTPTV